ncbi:MAG TPA: hypothetical protein VE074_04950 [Jatrophihabitantaceae bacterium]|nr:hypothetical protein [Jatrophihabitantaceae bacterium]
MHKFLLALHVLTAVFAIGPLAHAVTTASRGVRNGDAVATAASARMARLYGYVSVIVAVLGLSLVRPKWHAEFGDTWVWLSLVLWALAVALVLALIVPTLDRATTLITSGESARALTARVAAGGGLVGLIFAGIVFLMIYQPGR